MSSDFEESVTPKVFSGKGNFFENVFNDVVNATVNAGTGGMLSFKDGKLGQGVMVDAAREGGRATRDSLKEITGAKAAEEANAFAKEQFEDQKAAALDERANTMRQTAMDQVKQSNMAGALRASTRSNKGSSFLGNTERDFLGL